MTNDPVEDLLRRYRPVSPPPGLRARIVEAPAPKRVWPWAAAAAALLAVTIGMHLMTARLYPPPSASGTALPILAAGEVTLLREAGLHDLADRLDVELFQAAAGPLSRDVQGEDRPWPWN